jgi:trypsin-like peptidase
MSYSASRYINSIFAKLALCSLVMGAAAFSDSARAQDCRSVMEEFRSSIILLSAQKTITGTGRVDTATGTGFIVSSEGFVLTNDHLVRKDPGVDEIVITGSVGSRAASAKSMKIVGEDPEDDVAVLQFTDTSQEWKPVLTGDPAAVEIDNVLCSFGFPVDIDLYKTEGKLGGKGGPHGWWFASIDSNRGESGAPVFELLTRRVVALKVGERDDANHISYLIPLNLASTVFRDRTGLELLGRNSPSKLTEERALKLLDSYFQAVKDRDFKAWSSTLASYESDVALKKKENPEPIWPRAIAKLNSSYNEGFRWALGFGPHWSLGTPEFALYAGPISYELIKVVTEDERVFADVKLTYPRGNLRDWNGQQSIKSLIARVEFQNGKLKSSLSLSVPATTHTGSQYSDIVDLYIQVFSEGLDYYAPLRRR